MSAIISTQRKFVRSKVHGLQPHACISTGTSIERNYCITKEWRPHGFNSGIFTNKIS